jgi:hypothetical protein
MTPLPDDVRVLFDGANLAHVATLMPDGSPHSVPLWVGVEGSQIAFLTGPGARKARNLEHDPRVSISGPPPISPPRWLRSGAPCANAWRVTRPGR